ncbi:MAG: hypothetical protein ACP5JG_05850 [Anaerolineae bacterium]
METRFPFTLEPKERIGALLKLSKEAPIPDGTWYEAGAPGAGLVYTFGVGALADANYLTADWLLDGDQLAVFVLYLQEGKDGPAFRVSFGFLNQCSARMRVPLEAVNQNRWRYPREGAWLKPLCGGDRVDLNKVDRMRIEVARMGDDLARFCVTPVSVTVEEPALLDELVLPEGPLLDELGQSTIHTWQGKTRDADALVARLKAQRAAAPGVKWPEGYSQWGGWLERRVEGTGFFRTHHDNDRWWLVDPDGHLFWSSGLDCVRFSIETAYEGLVPALTWLPEEDSDFAGAHSAREIRAFNYLRANFTRAFGPDAAFDAWGEIALSQTRGFGFNTVGNWSDWEIARGKTPYVRPMDGRSLRGIPTVYRDFSDVYHPDFERAVAAFAEQLVPTVEDPALIGYFLMNEPSWGFALETPAAGMLYTTPSCHSRKALADFLRERYDSDEALAKAWEIDTTFEEVAEGEWSHKLTKAAEADLADFSEQMVTRYFGKLSEACRAVDPNHLNLGARYQRVPPDWAVKGMRSFDVFSMNCYKRKVPAEEMAQINDLLEMPIMIGEWHFGALDVGLPASGIGRVPDQASRGQAFRVYLEDAAAKPSCVGVHYFTLYDQSALGRFDGENYNIGFVDVCSRPYTPLAEAARASHARLYQVASGEVDPYDDEPVYLPRLFV